MDAIYILLMVGVSFMILATMYEAISAVSSKAKWEVAAVPVPAAFVERRTQSLPYVGVERRQSRVVKKVDVADPLPELEKQRKVA